MIWRLVFYLTLFDFLLVVNICFGQTDAVFLLGPDTQQVAVRKPFLHQLADPQNQYWFPTIRRPLTRWQPVNTVNFGSNGSPGWTMFTLRSPVRQTVWMEIQSHFIDSLHVWLVQNPERSDALVRHYQPTGFRIRTDDPDAPTRHRYYVKPLQLLPDIRYTVYIRSWVPPADVLKFGITLWRPVAFWQYQQHDLAGWAIFVGLVLMSVFITLISYAFHPRRIYLYYVGYISCMSIYAALNDGWGRFLPAFLEWFDNTSTVVHWFSIGVLFLMFFTRSFLAVDTKTGAWWLRLNPLWLALLLETTTLMIDYGVQRNQFALVQTGYQIGFIILGLYALLWLSYIADAIYRRFLPVWLYVASVLVWLFFYLTNVFVVNTGWLTEPFPDMLVFRMALLAEVGFIFIGWMYRQRTIRESQQHLQAQQQTRQQALLETERRRQTEELKALRLQHELQQQRERLARDLHDGIGSQLTHIAGRLDILSVRKTDEQAQLQRLSEFTRETNQSLRDTVWILNRSEILVSTFSQRLHAYLLRLWEDIDTPQLDWHTDPPPTDLLHTDPILPPLVVQCLFRIMQEAVNNALKYAGATRIRVGLIKRPDALVMTIADNGHGFDTTSLTHGYGLTNMQKRADEIGGQWALTSDSTGTRIHVSIDITT